MEARFAFFRAEDALAPLYTSDADNALISVQAFNNLLNSVSGLRRDGTFAYSYYSLDIERIDDDGDGTVDYQEVVQRPFEKTVTVGANPYTIVPKFNYQPLDATAIAGGTKTYAVDGAGAGTLVTWYATKASGYYEMVFHAYDDTQEIAVGEPVPAVVPPTPPPPIIGGGPDTALNTPVDGDDTVAGADIVDGGDTVAQAFVHGPLRAYRNLGAEDTSVNPAPTAVSTDGPNGDGDVAWSPRVCFRGRFFKIYVLARSITAIDAAGVYHYGSTRRSEIVYDALADRVLWRREPATEKHALGDPSVAP